MAGSIVRSQVGLPVTKEEEAAAVAAVRDMLGPDQQVLVGNNIVESCFFGATPEFMPMIQVMSVEKSVCVREEEVLLVNGTPITLEGEEGRAIKDCLLRGAIPNQVIAIIAPICSFLVFYIRT